MSNPELARLALLNYTHMFTTFLLTEARIGIFLIHCMRGLSREEPASAAKQP